MSSICVRLSSGTRVARSGAQAFAASSFRLIQLSLGLPVALSRANVPSIASPNLSGGVSHSSPSAFRRFNSNSTRSASSRVRSVRAGNGSTRTRYEAFPDFPNRFVTLTLPAF
ncbi:MAG: hypothetical protein M3P18_24120 [Actinomycetota bacterium]|nr:hypothetical protein [Actinomycetota bacterium]